MARVPHAIAHLALFEPTNGLKTMSNITMRVSLSALAVTAAMFCSGVAQAGFYDSNFDPFVFNGTARFQIGDNCLSSNGEHIANSGGCTSVDMEAFPTPFVKINDGTGGHTATLDFSSFITDSADMVSVAVIGGLFKGIDTANIGGFTAQGVDQAFFPGYWFVQFHYEPHFGGDFGTGSIQASNGFLSSVTNSVLLFKCETIHAESCGSVPYGLAETVGFVRNDRVPEPGTLGLILGALGAGWLARRRKAAA